MPGDEVRSSLETTIESYREEQERNRRELSEVDVLVRQGSAEVEKLSQRELSVSNRVRDLEVNLEKYNKDEIKNFYTAAQEVQMRLQMMRAQLEQLQLRQTTLRNRQEQLAEFITLLDEASHGYSDPNVERSKSTDVKEMIPNIIQAQEKERLRISLQMHDGPAQSMSNLVLRAEICQRLLERDVDQARAELTGLKTAINSTLQDTRRFIFELRPMILDDLGLVPTLRRFIVEFGEKNDLEINLMVQNLEMRLPSYFEVTIFRFIQTALGNVAQHANANQVRILLDVSNNTMHIVIEDDGSGFHVSEVLSDTSGRRNMGIASMRQQIEMILRGEFGIESAIGRGTRVAATIPLP